MVTCDMFQSQIIAPFFIITGTYDRTIPQKSLIGMGLARSYFTQSIQWPKMAAAFIWIGCIHTIQVKIQIDMGCCVYPFL